MAKTQDIDIKKVAKLGTLPLSQDEEKVFGDQLAKILDYMELLGKVDTSKTEPTYNTAGEKNSLREDKVEESLSQQDALKNEPKKKDAMPAGRQGFFVTKGVFDDE